MVSMDKLNAWRTEIEISIDATLAEISESPLHEDWKARRLENYMKALESLERIERMARENG